MSRFLRMTGLVLSGGGSDGFLHVGALRFLEELFLVHFPSEPDALRRRVRRVRGSSVGAGVALLFALGIRAERMPGLLLPLFEAVSRRTPLRPSRAGLASLGERLRPRVEALLGGCRTLGEVSGVAGCELELVVTDIGRGRAVTLTARSHPGVPVADAVLASMAVPLLFRPVHIAGVGWCCDGGVTRNFALSGEDVERGWCGLWTHDLAPPGGGGEAPSPSDPPPSFATQLQLLLNSEARERLVRLREHGDAVVHLHSEGRGLLLDTSGALRMLGRGLLLAALHGVAHADPGSARAALTALLRVWHERGARGAAVFARWCEEKITTATRWSPCASSPT